MNGARDYFLLALAGLAGLWLSMVFQGFGVWSFLPAAAGVGGLLVGWWVAVPAVLLQVAGLLVVWGRFGWAPALVAPVPVEGDLLQALAVFVYVGAATRYQSLAKLALPFDRRRKEEPRVARARGRGVLPAGPTRRSPESVGLSEVLWLLGLAVGCSLAGLVLASRLLGMNTPIGLALPDDRIWRVLVCVWALMLLLVGGASVVGAVGWLWASREEARLYLQDQLWTETRGEQRGIQRWRMWKQTQEGPR